MPIKIEGLTKADQAESILSQIDTQNTKYSGATYEQGIEIALQWMLGTISDTEMEENL